MHLGFTMQFKDADFSGFSVVVVASSSAGESWPDGSWQALMSVKTARVPSHGGRWQRLHVITLSKELPLQTVSSHS
jgi:hypothetical protein